MQLADQLRRDPKFMANVTRWEVIPARPAQTEDFPACLDERLKPVLARRGSISCTPIRPGVSRRRPGGRT